MKIFHSYLVKKLAILIFFSALGCTSETVDNREENDDTNHKDVGSDSSKNPDLKPQPDGIFVDSNVEIDLGDGDTGGEKASRLNLDSAFIDSVMAIPAPTKTGEYSLGGVPFYGKNAPSFLVLPLIVHDDPEAKDSSGILVLDRVLEHFRAAISPVSHPKLTGGHGSWFDQQVPIAIAVGRRTLQIWSKLSADEKSRTDTLMHHALHVANIFCNSNSARPGNYATVIVDMNMAESGSVPNQSSAYHAYGIATYIYFGGTAETTALLQSYDLASFRTKLTQSGFLSIEAMYANPALQRLFDGEKVHARA